MDEPSDSELMLRVAVLPAATGRIGDYLADVIALEAAGADSIWIDAGTQALPNPGFIWERLSPSRIARGWASVHASPITRSGRRF
ncbi:MAG TPA: hypothetical protein VGS16_17755 [Candidatus Dormibacteraeota bacterium]|nr:hypothetical protein [Candidatus Dormibacteraeota bacterium]